jgi:hypothetical protein
MLMGGASFIVLFFFRLKKHEGSLAFTQGKPVVSDILKILVLIGEIASFLPKSHCHIAHFEQRAVYPNFFSSNCAFTPTTKTMGSGYLFLSLLLALSTPQEHILSLGKLHFSRNKRANDTASFEKFS